MSGIGPRLLLATHNAGKLAEMQALLAPLGIEVVGAGAMGLAEPEETEESFVGNARIKAAAGVAATGLPTLADDSGLTVDALDGAPGVRTADWAMLPGGGRDFGMAMRRVHDALAGVPEPWAAQFRATLVLVWPDGREVVVEGVTPGRLVWPPRGAEGHGYDPMFVPDGGALTFGEMTEAAKNAVSHRGKAVAALLERLRA